MEEQNKETFAYEKNQDSSALLEVKKRELKELRIKAKLDKTVRIANNSKKRVIRDEQIEKIILKLRVIKNMISVYNRLGKVNKNKINIFEEIRNIITNDISLTEDIERTNINEEYEKDEPVTIEDIEKEAYRPEVDEANLNK